MGGTDQVSEASCPICKARLVPEDDRFCPSHQIAFDNLQDAYAEWVNAYGLLTKEGLLKAVAQNRNSGEWTIEVSRYLLRKGGAESCEVGFNQK
jgi:hypothetical protein